MIEAESPRAGKNRATETYERLGASQRVPWRNATVCDRTPHVATIWSAPAESGNEHEAHLIDAEHERVDTSSSEAVMQFHPKWGRSIRPVASGDAGLTVSRGWTRAHELPGRGVRPGLSAERVARIRERLESGYYHSGPAMDDLAGRLMAAGAL